MSSNISIFVLLQNFNRGVTIVSDIAETPTHKQIDILIESSYPTYAIRDFHIYFFFHRTGILGVLDEFAYV